MFTPSRELSELLASLCEQRLSESDRARLETQLLADREALRFYLQYVQLHGLLHWDAVGGSAAAPEVLRPAAAGRKRTTTIRRRIAAIASVAAAVCLLVVWWGVVAHQGGAPPSGLAEFPSDSEPEVVVETPSAPQPESGRIASGGPVRLGPSSPQTPAELTPPVVPSDEGSSTPPAAATAGTAHRSSESAVALIDRQLRDFWVEHEVAPSPRADDAEWVRRVHLDLVGQIPAADVSAAFIADTRPDKHARLVDDLLASPDFARHFSVVWSNLLIGHTSPREVNRPAFEKFLRDQFHRNHPWSETVTRLISAEGFEDVDGATNFLLAHVNNEAVPATAVTSRVLLCEQVQCTQCHNHPTGEWKQDRFWELNAFFQQTEIVRHRRPDAAGPGMARDRLELVSLETGGPTFYEDRFSKVNVAYPRFGDVEVDPSERVNRRQELARLLLSGDDPQVARAFVNRTWAKLFGYGFTDPIDDMGPHNQPVLGELLESLSREFVRSGYDVKQLLRWVCLSEAYQLSSRPGSGNGVDRPELGRPPLFSRMYVKTLSAEQLFDSLLVATQADRAGVRYWDEVESRRREWLEQFYTALDNDENAEDDAYTGSLAQTLVMMNGDLIRQATTAAPGTVLQQILARGGTDDDKIRMLSLATLSRYPTPEELASLRRMIRQQVQARSRELSAAAAQQEGLRDLMWAYLNSTEFRSNH